MGEIAEWLSPMLVKSAMHMSPCFPVTGSQEIICSALGPQFERCALGLGGQGASAAAVEPAHDKLIFENIARPFLLQGGVRPLTTYARSGLGAATMRSKPL